MQNDVLIVFSAPVMNITGFFCAKKEMIVLLFYLQKHILVYKTITKISIANILHTSVGTEVEKAPSSTH